MDTALALPVELEQIDAAWLTAALRTWAPDVTVERAEIVDVNHGTCTKVRVRLEVDAAGRAAGLPETLIVKGGFEPHSRMMAHMHKGEVDFYANGVRTFGLHTPTCYFTGWEPEGQPGIVILEDLVARGVRFAHPCVPQTPEQVARRLTSLAAFHAQTWGDPRLEDGEPWSWAPGTGAIAAYLGQFFVPGEWQRFVDLPRGAAASVAFHDREWARDALDRLVAVADTLPRCVLHSDTHLGNLYEDPDGTPGFFDGLGLRGPGMLEVTYHLGCALDPAERRRSERPLVQHYLDELTARGVAAPGLDEAMDQFGRFLHYGYLIFLLNESHYQPEANNTAYTARFSCAMLDHGTRELLS